MNIDKDICMITKTKFQDIREELDREYYKINCFSDCNNDTYGCRINALKKALDELLTLLDKAVT